MRILGIDPGTSQSGWVILQDLRPVAFGIDGNLDLRWLLSHPEMQVDAVVCEMIANQGMAVGASTFETCVWIGRFAEQLPDPWSLRFMYREQVKRHICGSARANDATVRQAIIDLYPPLGGGKVPQVGTKKQPGPLFGISSHIWQALGVAITATDLPYQEFRQRASKAYRHA